MSDLDVYYLSVLALLLGLEHGHSPGVFTLLLKHKRSCLSVLVCRVCTPSGGAGNDHFDAE
jgi:hypothetical protein